MFTKYSLHLRLKFMMDYKSEMLRSNENDNFGSKLKFLLHMHTKQSKFPRLIVNLPLIHKYLT